MDNFASQDLFKLKPSKPAKIKDIKESWKSLKEQELAMKRGKMQEEQAIKREKIKLQQRQVEIMDLTKRERDKIFYNSAIDPNLGERQLQELMQVKAPIKARYNLGY